MTFDPGSAPLAVLAIIALAAWLAHGFGERFAGWGWWRPAAFTLGIALIGVATLSPLDEARGDGLVSAHIGQHLILGDLAVVPLLIGMPPRTRRWLGGLLARLSGRRGLLGTRISRAISPFGALMLWVAASYFWFVPEIHRAAAPPGPAHLLEQFSFLLFGLLIWMLVFVPRPAQPGARAMRYRGLLWWARHIDALTSRLAMLPPAIVLWLAQTETYHVPVDDWRFSWTPRLRPGKRGRHHGRIRNAALRTGNRVGVRLHHPP